MREVEISIDILDKKCYNMYVEEKIKHSTRR